jgi:hypothetical protein
MANHISHASLPFPVKGCRFTLLVPYLDADGDPTDPTTPDTERSIDAGSFADCTEEVTTIAGSNGVGYITLTGDEMNGSAIALAAKVASGPKATLATLYPRVLPVIFSGTATAGAAGTITLSATNPPLVDDLIVGCIIRTTGGTGGGGGSGSQGNQARVVTDYVASTRVVTVSPNWETNPDSTTTYEVLLTDNALIRYSDLQTVRGAILNALIAGRMDSSVGAMAANVITDAAVSTDMDSYTAKVWVTKQGTTQDEYSVTFYKNTTPIESGITSAIIDYVKKMTDGSILVNDATLTEQSNGDYYYVETTNKLVAGKAYMSRITATIDGATRVMKQNVSRDSP